VEVGWCGPVGPALVSHGHNEDARRDRQEAVMASQKGGSEVMAGWRWPPGVWG